MLRLFLEENNHVERMAIRQGYHRAETVVIQKTSNKRAPVSRTCLINGDVGSGSDWYDVNICQGWFSSSHPHILPLARGKPSSHSYGISCCWRHLCNDPSVLIWLRALPKLWPFQRKAETNQFGDASKWTRNCDNGKIQQPCTVCSSSSQGSPFCSKKLPFLPVSLKFSSFWPGGTLTVALCRDKGLIPRMPYRSGPQAIWKLCEYFLAIVWPLKNALC